MFYLIFQFFKRKNKTKEDQRQNWKMYRFFWKKINKIDIFLFALALAILIYYWFEWETLCKHVVACFTFTHFARFRVFCTYVLYARVQTTHIRLRNNTNTKINAFYRHFRTWITTGQFISFKNKKHIWVALIKAINNIYVVFDFSIF